VGRKPSFPVRAYEKKTHTLNSWSLRVFPREEVVFLSKVRDSFRES
jgi:hypothetical protein